jgi:opacity protein-like surface antigen
MKRLLLITTSSLALSCLNTTAIADGHEDDLWTGAFVAIGGGLQSFSAEGGVHDSGFGTGITGIIDQDTSFGTDVIYEMASTFPGEDSFASAEIGYDVQVSKNYVLGVVAGIDSSGGSGTASVDALWGFGDFEGNGNFNEHEDAMAANLEISSVTHLGGRAGFLVTPQTLIFGTASMMWGTAQMSFTGSLSDFFEDGSALSVNDSYESVNVNGISIGIGVERMLQNNWSIKAEVRRTRYDYDNEGHEVFNQEFFEGSYAAVPYEGLFYTASSADSIEVNSLRVLAVKRF